jgi:hypothetical protein
MSSLTLEPLTLEPVEVQWNPVEVMQNFDPVYRGLVSKSPQHRGTLDSPLSITPFKCSPQHRGTLDTPLSIPHFQKIRAKSPLKELEDGVKQLRQEVEELKEDYQITPSSMHANPGTPNDASHLLEFTDKPRDDVVKPKCIRMCTDESYELISKELEQEDFPQYEETYLQCFRRVVMGSNTLLHHNPYLTVPVVAFSLATFGFE